MITECSYAICVFRSIKVYQNRLCDVLWKKFDYHFSKAEKNLDVYSYLCLNMIIIEYLHIIYSTPRHTQHSCSAAYSFNFAWSCSPSPPGFPNSSTSFSVTSNTSFGTTGFMVSRYFLRVSWRSGTGNLGSGFWKTKIVYLNN